MSRRVDEVGWEVGEGAESGIVSNSLSPNVEKRRSARYICMNGACSIYRVGASGACEGEAGATIAG